MWGGLNCGRIYIELTIIKLNLIVLIINHTLILTKQIESTQTYAGIKIN